VSSANTDLVWPEDAMDMILLVGHGSKDPAGEAAYRAFASALQQRLGVRVQPAFLEFNAPAVLDGMESCVAAGARRVVVLPLFLGAATHQKNDVPTAITLARTRYPRVSFVYGTPLGTHAAVAEAVGACAHETLAAAGEPAGPGTIVLLVGRGSRDPDSNGDLYKVSRLVYESGRFAGVEACFIAIATPDLSAGVERCIRLGARRIVAVPYMLFTGVLVNRMRELLVAHTPSYPGVGLFAAPPLGRQPHLLAAVEERIAEAMIGEAHANCDTCKYRVRMTGFEAEYGLAQGSDHHHGLRSNG